MKKYLRLLPLLILALTSWGANAQEAGLPKNTSKTTSTKQDPSPGQRQVKHESLRQGLGQGREQSRGQGSGSGQDASSSKRRPQILVETSKGKFILELFHETPQHRDAFLRLVREGRYEGTIFHRVIKGFMVQGGNLLSKGLKVQDELPDDSISGKTPAEFRPELFVHTRGMLAAARQSDEINPERASSASQFYIVTGKYYTSLDLKEESQKHGIQYSPAQQEAYMREGGAAHLDGTYTIFGRLLDGYKVIDKIQRVETNDDDRPLKNIVIKRMSILP